MKPILLCWLLCLPLAAQENRELLRDALYTEEVSRDPAAAAVKYQEILIHYADQRALAATALFRMAEIKQKQGQKEDAAKLYQRVLVEFPDFQTEAKIARDTLASAGITPTAVVTDEQTAEIQRLQEMLKTAPDNVRSQHTLMQAIAKGWTRVVEFLLKNGVDGSSPEAIGTAVAAGRLDLCKRLMPEGTPSDVISERALVTAVSKRKMEILKYLLERGCDPNLGDGDIAVVAVNTGDLQITQYLFDHGMKATSAAGAIWRFSELTDEMLDLLIRNGVSPSQQLIDEEFRSLSDSSRFVRRFIYPKYFDQPKIWLILENSNSVPQSLAARQKEEVPPLLHRLLLKSNYYPIEPFDATYSPTKLEIIRRENDGKVKTLTVSLLSADPLPTLQWGDIVKVNTSVTSYSTEQSQSEKWRMLWNLRKRVEVPVVFEEEGKSRELILRGNMLIYNPKSKEVPLLDVGSLARLLWSPPGVFDAKLCPKIIVKREGWGEIPIDYNSSAAYDFPLKAGDRFRIERDRSLTPEATSNRGNQVIFTVPGTGYSRSYTNENCPTLIQVLTDSYSTNLAPNPNDENSKSSRGSLGRIITSATPVVLPNPDFSNIRIKRLHNGEEKIMDINLASTISRCTDATSAQEARKSDVELQAGDIVELPLSADTSKPWQGFTPEQSRFFHKVLSGNIQVFTDGTEPQLLMLDWQPTEWIETEAGKIPFRPQSGWASVWWGEIASSKNWSYGPNEELKVERNGKTLMIPSDGFFAKEGDRIYRNSSRQARGPRIIPPKGK